MRARTAAIAMISAILAGCGGGGSDTAVSSTPPAATPPAAQPAPSGPPAAPAPQPNPAPVPVPQPTAPVPPPVAPKRSAAAVETVIRDEFPKVTTHMVDGLTMVAWIAHFQQPQFDALDDGRFRQAVNDQVVIDRNKYFWAVAGTPAAPPPPPPAARTLSGQVIGRAMNIQSTGRGGPIVIEPGYSSDPRIFVYQSPWTDYQFGTGVWNSGSSPYARYDALTLQAPYSFTEESLYLGTDLNVTFRSDEQRRLVGPPLTLAPTAQIPLDSTIHEWVSPVGTEPWFARLRLETHTADSYRLCWQFRLPQINRKACHVFQNGDPVGTLPRGYVEDNPTGFTIHKYGEPPEPGVSISGNEILGSLGMNYNPANSGDFANLRELGGSRMATVSQGTADNGYGSRDYRLASLVNGINEVVVVTIGSNWVGPTLTINGIAFTSDQGTTYFPATTAYRFDGVTSLATWRHADYGVVNLELRRADANWLLCWSFYSGVSARQICNAHRSSDNVHRGATLVDYLNTPYGRQYSSVR